MTTRKPEKSAARARASHLAAAPATASTADAPTVRTEGQRLLRELPHTLSQIGEVAGVSKQAVSMWTKGAKLPDEHARRRLLAEYAIPLAAWARPPRDLEAESEHDEAAISAATSEGYDEPETDDVLEDCKRHLARIKRQLRNPALTARERMQLNESFTRTLVMKAKLQKDAELSEDRFVRSHPAWLRFRTAIMSALLEHPAAAKDVEAALMAAGDTDDEPDTATDDDEELDE